MEKRKAGRRLSFEGEVGVASSAVETSEMKTERSLHRESPQGGEGLRPGVQLPGLESWL